MAKADQAKPNASKNTIHLTKSLTKENSDPPHSITALKPSNKSERPWWLGDLISIAAIIIGAIMVVCKLGWQHKQELILQKENHREQFRIQIYQEFSKFLGLAIEKNISSKMYASNISMNMHIYHDLIKKNLPPVPLSARAVELSKRHNDTIEAAAELIFLIRRYQIVDPRLDIFRTALNAAIHDMRETLRPLFPFLLEVLPVEIPRPNGSYELVNIINPSDEQVNKLEKLVNAYTTASDDMISYLYDLNVELQNTLLINLFPNKALRRVPIDPKFKVISTEPNEVERLQKYFNQETDWGKKMKQAEQRVREQTVTLL